MKKLSHQSAKPSHYNQDAKHYDVFNEENSASINKTIEKFLKRYKAKTVLDLTCGTGSQVFWLTEHGYDVVGSDINSKMLNVARTKAKEQGLAIKFLKADMRDADIGTFDAAITIFNAVGHLTKADFAKAVRNIGANLKEGGLYIFDIFNLSCLLDKDNITTFTIDWFKRIGDTTARVIQYSTIDKDGVMASFTREYEQTTKGKPKVIESAQTLQIYRADELRDLLKENGFLVLNQCAVDGSKFNETTTDRILTVAKKMELPNDQQRRASSKAKRSISKSQSKA